MRCGNSLACGTVQSGGHTPFPSYLTALMGMTKKNERIDPFMIRNKAEAAGPLLANTCSASVCTCAHPLEVFPLSGGLWPQSPGPQASRACPCPRETILHNFTRSPQVEYQP